MTRITINNPAAPAIVSLWLLLTCVIAGCSSSDDFHRSDLTVDSPTGRQITQLLTALHHLDDPALDAYVNQHVAPGLDDSLKAGMRATLKNLASAQQVTLTAVDRFGDEIIRAQLHVTTPAGSQTTNLLLIESDHQLLWAGSN